MKLDGKLTRIHHIKLNKKIVIIIKYLVFKF